MKVNSNQLIEELTTFTKSLKSRIEKFKHLELAQLNWKENEASWSILECTEHLNLYGDFYIPEIKNKINCSSSSTPSTIFKSGLLGNYFANSMKPKMKLNKMKTFKDKNPIGSQLDKNVFDKFIMQQEQIIRLLNKAKSVNLNKIKTRITLPVLKFKLGDSFRFTIYHNERHVIQAEKILRKTTTERPSQVEVNIT